MKGSLIYICVLLASLASAAQSRLYYDTGARLNWHIAPQPVREVVQDDRGYEVTYTFESALIVPESAAPGAYYWKFAGFGLNDTEGEPAFPQRFDRFEIPNGCTPTVTIKECQTKDFDYPIAPAQAPVIQDEDNPGRAIVPISSDFTWGNEDYATLFSTEDYRGQQIAVVRTVPVGYSADKATAVRKITYRVDFGESVPVYRRPAKLTRRDPVYQDMVITFNRTEDEETAEADIDYLILSTPEMQPAIDRFARWKKNLGFTMHVETKAKWTQTEIQNTITEYYNNVGNLRYLLFLGSPTVLPYKRINFFGMPFTPSCATYNKYCEIEDGTKLCCGIMPAYTKEEALAMVNKAVQYESVGISDVSVYNKAVHCAQFEDTDKDHIEDSRFTKTSEDIRDYVISKGLNAERIYAVDDQTISPKEWAAGDYGNGGEIPQELQRPNFAWDGNATEITHALNSGCSYILHRDHGKETCWGIPNFNISNVDQLDNHGLALPVVFSINCLTGAFTKKEFFCRSLLKNPKGGAAMAIGASDYSYSGYNDAFVVGIFDAVWPDPGLLPDFGNSAIPTASSPRKNNCYSIGDYIEAAKARMRETFAWQGSQDKSQLNYQDYIFHIFGDPSSIIYLKPPYRSLSPSITRSKDGIIVKTDISQYISFYDAQEDKVYRYFGNYAQLPSSHQYYVNVCVCTPGTKPYINRGLLNIEKPDDPIFGELLDFEIVNSPAAQNVDVEIVNLSEARVINCSLQLRDQYGTLVEDVGVSENLTNYSLGKNKIGHGLYFVSLLLNNSIINTKTVIK